MTIAICLFLCSLIFSIIMEVFAIICKWKIFEKANEPGWASIVPFYNQYIYYKIAKKKTLFAIYIFCTVLNIICVFTSTFITILLYYTLSDTISGISSETTLLLSLLFGCIGFILSICIFVLKVFRAIGITKEFNLNIWYSVGLILAPTIFEAIIAFSKDIKYKPYSISYESNYY